MKYDGMEISDSYNYEHENVVRGKTRKRHRYDPLDIAVVSSICAVIISTTVLVSRLMSTGIMDTVMNSIA